MISGASTQVSDPSIDLTLKIHHHLDLPPQSIHLSIKKKSVCVSNHQKINPKSTLKIIKKDTNQQGFHYNENNV